MPRTSPPADPKAFQSEMTRRYEALSDRADRALDRLSDLPTGTRKDVEHQVERVEGARELMSSQVMAMRRAQGNQFRMLQNDARRVSSEFEQAVEQLQRLTSDAAGRSGERRGRSGGRGRYRAGEHPHPEPGDVI